VPAERISQLVLFLVDKLRQFTSGRVDALRFTVKKFFLMQDDGAKGGLTYAEFGHFLTSLGMELPQVEKRGLFEHLAHLGAQATGEWVMYDELCRVCDELNAGTSETRYVSGEPPQSLVDKIRTHLLAKHPRGLQSLPLAFRHIDRENTRWVVHNDFNSGLRQCGLRLTKEDVTRLLAFYDPSSTDKVHYDRFIAHIRGAIGDERLGYIERGWAKVCAADGGGTEQVAATTLQRVFEPSMHPKVANNHQTPQAKIADLLDFAQEGDVVTRAQFLEYFLDDSSSISEDCYFERYMVTAFAL
jgi:Ca2+-binding EF-hand superfamily protein